MTQFNATSYDIQRPTGVCAFTGRTLEPGESYYAALVELDNDSLEASPDTPKPASAVGALGFKRLDVSSEAWDAGSRPEGLFSFWKSTIAQPSEKKKNFVDDGVLMDLLRRLEDTDQPQRLAFRYVLALVLMHKKLIRYDGTERKTFVVEGQETTQEWWQFTPKLDLAKGPMGKWNEEETLTVLDPRLDAGQIEQVTGQLGEILEGEL